MCLNRRFAQPPSKFCLKKKTATICNSLIAQCSSDQVEPRVESEPPCAINVQTAIVDSHEILFLLIPFDREEHSQFNFGTSDPASGEKKPSHKYGTEH